MTEQLISFNTAKLAKEKGFNWPTLFYYFENYNAGLDYILVDDILTQFGNIEGVEDHNRSSYYCNRYSVPTQSHLQKWIREVHTIHIEISSYNDNDKIIYEYWIKDFRKDADVKVIDGMKNYNTYEEALEAGLSNVLLLNKDNFTK